MTVRSIFTGLTGVTAMARGIDVIGNNIANVNTVGYRASRATFDDIYSQTLFAGVGAEGSTGGVNPRQLGTGVSLGSVDLIFTQGNVQTTGRLLDLAIQGDGFFVTRNSSSQEILTRAGNFTLDSAGYIIDPGTGNRLLGRQANSLGQIDNENPINDLKIDFNVSIPAEETTFVNAGGNVDPESEEQAAKVSSNLRGLFNRYGESLGLVAGDVLRFETGFVQLGDAPDTVDPTIDLATFDFGLGAGVIMSITEDTTIEDLQDALDSALDMTVEQSVQGAQSGFDVQFDSDLGQFVFRTQNDSLEGLRLGLEPRGSNTIPPTNSELIGEIFVTRDDPNFTKTLDVAANSTVRTESFRQANSTSSIEIFDSQGNSHTLTLGFAKDTRPTEAISTTPLSELRDRDGREILEGGFPPPIKYSYPVIDSTNNTAVYTATQVDNIVATQGVVTFNAGDVMIGLRISDGAISFNGGTFYYPGQTTVDNTPTGVALNADSIALLQALDVTDSERLNIGGGLMGEDGFEEDTTLESIRNNIETRINSALAGISAAISTMADDPLNTVFDDAVTAGDLDGLIVNGSTVLAVPTLDTPATAPQIDINLTSEGSMEWTIVGGNLGSAVEYELSSNPQLDIARAAALATNAGGEEQLALQLDLAAKTRSIRVSTLRDDGTGNLSADNEVDDVIAGGVTGFTSDPFNTVDLGLAFEVGDTDFAGALGSTAVGLDGKLENNDATDTRPFEQDGALALVHDPRDTNPALAPDPLGVFDSGVQIVALTSGVYDDNPSRLPTSEQTAGFFAGTQAFEAQNNAFNALFNSRGFGIAQDADGDGTLDRLDSTANGAAIANGIAVAADDVSPFETNTFHSTGVRNNSWGWQVVLPNNVDNVPLGYTGTIDFTSEGLFNSYGDGSSDTPTINFDPDGEDPVNGGVTPISFSLDLTGMTQFGQAKDTATLLEQDGRAVGALDSVSISTDGQILGIFTNGATRALGQVVLAQVTNEGGLLQVGDTGFTQSPNSGQPVVFDPGEGGTGEITSGQLELSNVDLANEFSNLIVTQRAFQASSRMITTGDTILQEVVNLVR